MMLPQDWQPADDLMLEPNALQAVRESDLNVIVSAGPGAGKTELLAQRADFLLTTGVCPFPQRILAISFKVDAARNLRSRVRKRCGTKLAARFDSFTFHAFAKRLVDNYRVLFTGADALEVDYTLDAKHRIAGRQITFDDLVPLAIKILQSSASARNSIRQTYTHVFLDEFQDATRNQYALLKDAFLTSGVILTAVGDSKQRIMRWAGALDGIMHTFAYDFEAESLTLYHNFRSVPRLRRMQNRMVEVMDPAAAVPMTELAGDEGSLEVHTFATAGGEAKMVADRIAAWLADGTSPREIAVLVRQQPHLVCESLMAELASRGIAWRNEQLRQDLTVEPATALIFALLRVLADNRRSIDYQELVRLTSHNSSYEEGALRRARAISRFISAKRDSLLVGANLRADAAAWSATIHEFLDLATRSTLTALSPDYEQGSRLEQVIEQSITAFQEQLAVDGNASAALSRLSESDAVRILNIHKCKGLEFEKVVVYGVETELFWGTRIEDNRAGVLCCHFTCETRPYAHLD